MTAIAFRQAYHSYPANAQTGVAVQAGDLIVVFQGYAGTVVAGSACSDNAAGGSNTYAAATTFASASGAAIESFYAIAKATATLTITATAQSDSGITVHVFSNPGAPLGSVFDAGAASVTASNLAHRTNNVATTVANEALSVLWFDEQTVAVYSDTNGFTLAHSDPTHSDGSFYKITSATDSYAQAISSNVATNSLTAMILAFKGAPATPPPVITFRQGYNSYQSATLLGITVQAGDLIVVFQGYSGAVVLGGTCIDNAAGGSNTYATGPTFTDGSSLAIESFYAIAKAAETLNLTLTLRSFVSITVHVYANPNPVLSAVFDVGNSSLTASGTAHSTATITTAANIEGLSVFWVDRGLIRTYTDTNGFTLATSNPNQSEGSFSRVTSTAGAYFQSITSSGSTAGLSAMILAFKSAPPPAPPSASGATPGRKLKGAEAAEERKRSIYVPQQIKGETPEETQARRIAQGIIADPDEERAKAEQAQEAADLRAIAKLERQIISAENRSDEAKRAIERAKANENEMQRRQAIAALKRAEKQQREFTVQIDRIVAQSRAYAAEQARLAVEAEELDITFVTALLSQLD